MIIIIQAAKNSHERYDGKQNPLALAIQPISSFKIECLTGDDGALVQDRKPGEPFYSAIQYDAGEGQTYIRWRRIGCIGRSEQRIGGKTRSRVEYYWLGRRMTPNTRMSVYRGCFSAYDERTTITRIKVRSLLIHAAQYQSCEVRIPSMSRLIT
jgi:hypothetical protein